MISLVLLVQIGKAQETNKQKFKKLEWLIGKWTRTNAKTGQSGYETWTKGSDSKLTGKGVTLKGKEIIFVENLQFIVKGADIFYAVSLTGEDKPVLFKLTALSTDSFACENPSHDFPKKIMYSRSGNKVKAVISGNGQSVGYLFIRARIK